MASDGSTSAGFSFQGVVAAAASSLGRVIAVRVRQFTAAAALINARCLQGLQRDYLRSRGPLPGDGVPSSTSLS